MRTALSVVALAAALGAPAQPAPLCKFTYSDEIKRNIVVPITEKHSEFRYDVDNPLIFDKESPVRLQIYAVNVLDSDPLIIRIDACTGKLVDAYGGAEYSTTIVPCPTGSKAPRGAWCGETHKN